MDSVQLLESAAVCHDHDMSHLRGVIGLLVDEVNPLVSVMKVDKAGALHSPWLLCDILWH